jgi:hypothetical protein
MNVGRIFVVEVFTNHSVSGVMFAMIKFLVVDLMVLLYHGIRTVVKCFSVSPVVLDTSFTGQLTRFPAKGAEIFHFVCIASNRSMDVICGMSLICIILNLFDFY